MLVDKDKNDYVARKFLRKSPRLKRYIIKNVELPWHIRLRNIIRFKRSQFKKKLKKLKLKLGC